MDSNRQLIEADFPILQRKINGQPLVYLDSAATSLTPNPVVKAMAGYYREYNANIHRGIHTLAEEANKAYEQVRAQVSQLIGAGSSAEIIFVRNTTEAINLVATSWAMEQVGPGDEILITEMEHHANLIPWQRVARNRRATLKFIPVDGDGRLQIDEALFTPRTKLVAFSHVSNVLGTINPAKILVDLAHKVGAAVLVDAAQSVPHLPVDVSDLDADFVAFSGHKMLGPTGVGVLYAKQKLLQAMEPYQVGGDMIRRVSFQDAEWNDIPFKFEAGTPNIAGVIGLGAAITYLESIGLENIQKRIGQLEKAAHERLSEIDGITVYGPDSDERVGVVSFNIDGIHAHDLATLIDRQGIAIRSGHHCAQPLVQKFGVPAMARASFYIYNSMDDIDRLVEAIGVAHATMRK